MVSTTVRRSALRIGLVTAAVLLLPLVAMRFTEEVDWSPFDFAFAAALLAGSGCLLELAVRRPAGILYRAGAGLVGAAAVALGMADDAPGLVLFGLLLFSAAAALTARAARRGA